MTPHVLLMPLPARGHVTPALAVAAELVKRGKRVTFATVKDYADEVTETGATALVYESELATHEIPAAFTVDYMAREPLRCIEEAIRATRILEAELAGDFPDVVVYDVATFPTGRALARKHGRPSIQLFPVFASNEEFSFGAAQAEELAEPFPVDHPAFAEFFVKVSEFIAEHELGIGAEELLVGCDESNIVFLPRRFQLEVDKFDDRHTFVGPCRLPAKDEVTWRREGDGPLALISLGTTFNHNADFFRDCARAFTGLPWEVVITLGDKVDPAELGELPPNVRAHRFVPHAPVLAEADVFVCHAGVGSMMEALDLGVPLVLVPPEVTEHRLNAKRAVELGLGRMLAPADATPDALRDAVLSVAADPAVRTAVTGIRADFAAAGGPVKAAEVIEASLTRAAAL
ncbi:macrolide family glycosyltransferase [Amycolatopsis minnesotensis]|uniref:Macrolide-inactivating glycosyltransferase n=1 Tax=Amycolatopsis minnesotensis TaxID=337894 RepID=A0ABN2QH85_9PSEU